MDSFFESFSQVSKVALVAFFVLTLGLLGEILYLRFRKKPPSPPPLNPPPNPPEGEVVMPPPAKTSPFTKKTLLFLGILLILAAIPTTAFLVKQRQEVRKKAETPLCCQVGMKVFLCPTTQEQWRFFTDPQECQKWFEETRDTWYPCLPGEGIKDNAPYTGCQWVNTSTTEKRDSCNPGETSVGCAIRCFGQLEVISLACPSPTPTPTPTPTTRPTPTPTLRPTATPTPPLALTCTTLALYSSTWQKITDFSSLKVGQPVFLVVSGTPAEKIVKARFRVTVGGTTGPWQETTQKRTEGYFLSYTLSQTGNYRIEAMLFDGQSWR